MTLNFIITGTGRCGTVYMARLLTSLGIPCSHEGIFTHQGYEIAKGRLENNRINTSVASTIDKLSQKTLKPWLFDPAIADSSYMAAPFLDRFPEAKVIHVLRNPILVLSSFVNDVRLFANDPPEIQKPYQKFVYSVMPELTEIEREIDRVAHYIVHWNKLIEPHAHFIHRVEEAFSPSLAEFLNKDSSMEHFSDNTINTWRKGLTQSVSVKFISDPIREEFIELARKHRYLPLLL